MKEIKKAHDIAKRSLKACYLGKGILASCDHFSGNKWNISNWG